MTPEDVVFKLGQLQPDEIARVMKDSGVLAVRGAASACAVTQYVYQETKATHIRTGSATISFDEPGNIVDLPDSVRHFIGMFDGGRYPELDADHPMNMEIP